VFGGLLWVALFVFGGYYFGSIEIVRERFEIVVLAIIGLSVLPIAWEWWRSKRAPQPARVEG
jgi:membrane-associated protein